MQEKSTHSNHLSYDGGSPTISRKKNKSAGVVTK
jgi:hypothetical protein